MLTKRRLYASVVILIFSIFLVEVLNTSKPKHPDAGLNVEQLIRKYGYPLETHRVTTEDGYILTLHRIPHGRKEQNDRRRIPILFMHGFIQSSTEFINLGPEKALPFLLADKGYDIWLGNARGSTWSRKHKILNPNKDEEFWHYSLDEIGLYDVPAFIDHILGVTGEEKLHYVGYSQGTSVFFIMVSEKPQYADKIRLMSALAPAVFLKDPKGVFLGLYVYFWKDIKILVDLFHINELFSSDSFVSFYLKRICDENSVFVDLCLYHISIIQGYNPSEVNKTMLSLIFTNTPAGVSQRQMIHIAQLMDSGDFHRYNLGNERNLEIYGQENPPRYDLSKVTTPVALYYSNNDWTINIENIKRIVRTLPNVVKSYSLENFNHNDFVHAKNAVTLLYNSVIEEILKY